MNFSKSIHIFSFFILATNFSRAQSFNSLTTEASKNRIEIGEQFELKVRASYSASSNSFFQLPDSFPHFEIIETPSFDTSFQNGITIVNITYNLTSFDSGRWVIPPFTIANKTQSKPLTIDVIFSDFDAQQPYYDIKGIIENQEADKKKTWWWYAAAGLFTAIVIGIYLRKRKRREVRYVSISKDPFNTAMEKLQSLRNQSLSSKEYYESLTIIFREYIFNKKGIMSLQKTTNDLLVQLKEMNLPASQYDKLTQALLLSDFVKFAKYPASKQEDETVFEVIKETIIIINNKI